MVDWGSEFSILQGIHVRFDIKIDISVSLKPVITKLGKQVKIQDLT